MLEVCHVQLVAFPVPVEDGGEGRGCRLMGLDERDVASLPPGMEHTRASENKRDD